MRIGFFIIIFFLISGVYGQNLNNYQSKLAQLDSVLIERISSKGPGLSMIITQDEQVIFERYYGFAVISADEMLNAQHVLGIASVSKQFTGMATLFLVEEGKLSLDDDIRDYLPDLPLDNRKISIRQLLSHTSGLPELTRNEEFMKNIAQPHRIDEIISIAFEGDFTANPGDQWQYCNTGYTIITALIEKLSGQTYSEFLKEKIFDPLHMDHTYACDYYQDADNAAPRYFPDSTGYVYATKMHFSNLIGGGSIVTNAEDMAKWGVALTTGANLPANYQELWQSNMLNSGEATGYGLGMGNNSFQGKAYYYHPGMGDGMNSIILVFPEDKMTITVIRNVSKPELSSMEAALTAAEYLLF